MNNIQQIAISRISDILTKGNLINPERDGLKRVFYNAGLSEIYEEKKHRLQEKMKEENWEERYYFNDKTYSAFMDIFIDIIDNTTQIIKLFNCLLERISINSIFVEEIDKKLNMFPGYQTLYKYLTSNDISIAQDLIQNFPSKDFAQLRSNLNILALDINFDNDLILKISTFTPREYEEKPIKSGMVNWLEINYPNILQAYESSVKMCSEGNVTECLSDCRNVITGIFSYHKDEGTKWYTGLQIACKADKNIENIEHPNNIIYWNNGQANNPDKDKRYNYPRFKTIHQIYSLLSDLGPHKDEGNIKNGNVDYEIPSFEDAQLGLRLTESILVWLYQNQLRDL